VFSPSPSQKGTRLPGWLWDRAGFTRGGTTLTCVLQIKARGVQFPRLQKMCHVALPPVLQGSSPGETPESTRACFTSSKAEEWPIQLEGAVQTRVVALCAYCLALNGSEICTHLQFLSFHTGLLMYFQSTCSRLYTSPRPVKHMET